MLSAMGIVTPYAPLGRELTELARETQPELLYPTYRQRPRRGRLATAAATLVGTAAISLSLCFHAFAEPVDPAQELARVQHACGTVLALDAAEVPYQDCVTVLKRDLPPAGGSTVMASAAAAGPTTRHQASAACADIGLAQGGFAHGQCVADLNETLSDAQQIYR
jgi:hypothetical protein